MLGEVEMVGRDRWEESHRRAGAGGAIRVIARELDYHWSARGGDASAPDRRSGGTCAE